jgi:hypothetical protein
MVLLDEILYKKAMHDAPDYFIVTRKFSREGRAFTMSGNRSKYQLLPKNVQYFESKGRLPKHNVRHFTSCLHNCSVKSVSVPPTQRPIYLLGGTKTPLAPHLPRNQCAESRYGQVPHPS